MTFFKLGIDHLSAVLFAGESAVSVDFSSGINLDTSTLGTRSCSSMIGLSVPILDVHLLQRDFHSRKWRSAGSMTTNLSVDLYNAPKGWQEKASLQQDFIREQDAPTHRIWYMYRDSHETPGEFRHIFLC